MMIYINSVPINDSFYILAYPSKDFFYLRVLALSILACSRCKATVAVALQRLQDEVERLRLAPDVGR